MLALKDYIPLIDFLGNILGDSCEIVLHDLTTPDNSIIAIANGEISGRKVGGPVTDLLLKILKNGDDHHNSYYSNYHGKNINGHICLCSSFFIRDEHNNTIGVLCINRDISHFIQARDYITEKIICDNKLSPVLGEKNTPAQSNISILENLQDSAENVIDTLIDNTLGKYDLQPTRLSMDERMEVIAELNESGLFLLKGGITALANKLNVSEPTVYRYLGKLKKEKS